MSSAPPADRPEPNERPSIDAATSLAHSGTTPWFWRVLIGLVVLLLVATAYALQGQIGLRGRAFIGTICFLAMAAACSSNLRAVNWRTISWGIALQWLLALFVIKFEVFGVRPGRELFLAMADTIKKFLDFSDVGAQFVFGKLADPKALDKVFPNQGFVFAFSALPAIIFVSSFFSLLHYLGVIQFLVSLLAQAMKYVMKTSGAETLATLENVFMGQSESPFVVRPYVPRMTRSELLALMTAGMATMSGGMITVYIGMGAEAVAILATSVMSAPCSLYISKLILPETDRPETVGGAGPAMPRTHANALDAIAEGAATGMRLALNIAAMLIAFLAFLALIDSLLTLISSDLSLHAIFSRIFSPVAFLIGTSSDDVPIVADLLGIKLVSNEFVAYVHMTGEYREVLSPRAYTLATYALAGFANFSSIGIQLGATGALAPERRQDLASLGLRALFGGFLATLLNASIAGVLLDAP